MAWTPPVNFAEPQIVDEVDLNLMQDNLREVWRRLAYVEFTANVSTSTATELAPLDIVSSGALTYEATPVKIELYTPAYTPGNGAISFWDASTDHGRVASLASSGIIASVQFTPTAASHTYKFRIWQTGGGTATIVGGPGGTGAIRPGSITVWQKGGA